MNVSTFWRMIKTGMFSDMTHLSLAFQYLFTFCQTHVFIFWFFSSANMNIMLTTVVKTHSSWHAGRVCVCVCVIMCVSCWKQEIKMKRKRKIIVPQTYTHADTQSRSNPSLPENCRTSTQTLLLLLLHGTNNRNNTSWYSYYYVLFCHASSLQYCFYISLYYTERQDKSKTSRFMFV